MATPLEQVAEEIDDLADSVDRKDAIIEQMAADYKVLGEKYLAQDAEIARLIDAIWEYGEHRKSCRIDSGKECDCGFFEIIKSLGD